MKKDKHKTKVKFLVNETNQDILINSDVFAFFPEEIEGDKLRSSYAHVGQHSPCHVDYANDCKKAISVQYVSLFNELTSIGYDLEVIN